MTDDEARKLAADMVADDLKDCAGYLSINERLYDTSEEFKVACDVDDMATADTIAERVDGEARRLKEYLRGKVNEWLRVENVRPAG